MTRVRKRFPPGIRSDIRLNHRRDRKLRLLRRLRKAGRAGRRLGTNVWFVALVGGMVTGLAVAWLTLN